MKRQHHAALASALLLVSAMAGCAKRAVHAPAERAGKGTEGFVSGLQAWELYADHSTSAAVWWRENRLEHPAEAEMLRRMAALPTAHWLTKPETRAESEGEAGTKTYLRRAARAGRLPVLVLYNIVERDHLARYSQGGAANTGAYRRFVEDVDRVIGAAPVLIIVEPDALAALPQMSPQDRAQRILLLNYAVTRLSQRANRFVYLDVGHARWLTAESAARLARQCGIARAQGFALNTSNFCTLQESAQMAREICRLLGGTKTAVIDTSRSGNGPSVDKTWCNPSGRALGPEPTTQTAYPIDALLWVKPPWESDGDEGNAPPAGQLYIAYALELARNAGW